MADAYVSDPRGDKFTSDFDGTGHTPKSIMRPAVPIVSTALENSHVMSAAPGSITSLTVVNGAASGWVLLFDAVALPANGAVTPKWFFQMGANSSMATSFNPPWQFATGIVAGFSTTGPFVLTASATAAFAGTVQ